MTKIFKKIERHFKAGEMIFREGDVCDGIYSIQSGLVTIFKLMPADMNVVQVELARLGPGTLFGEMGIFQPDGRREANVKALEFTKIIIITPQMLEEQIGNLPAWAGNIFRILVERLQVTNDRLLDATAKLQELEALGRGLLSTHTGSPDEYGEQVEEQEAESGLEDSAGLSGESRE